MQQQEEKKSGGGGELMKTLKKTIDNEVKMIVILCSKIMLLSAQNIRARGWF